MTVTDSERTLGLDNTGAVLPIKESEHQLEDKYKRFFLWHLNYASTRKHEKSQTLPRELLLSSSGYNKMSRSEKLLTFESLTAVYVFFHRVTGVLPLENRDFSFLRCRMLLTYFVFVGLVNSVMFLRYGIVRLIQGAVELDNVFESVMVVSTIARYYVLVNRRFEFRDAMEACRAIWEECTPSEHQIVRCFERKTWTLFKLLVGSCVLINVFSTVVSIVVRLPAEEPNGTERRMLPYRWFTDEREYRWLGYELTFGLQVLILQHVGVITASVDTAGPLLMMISCGYFKALQERFFTAADLSDRFAVEGELQFQRTLVSCSKFHQNVLNLCKKIEVITRMIFMVQLMCLGYNISLIGLKLAGYIPNLVLCLGTLFISQWASDYLLEESEAVATAAYFTTLMSLNSQIGRLLLTVIERAQTPVQMTAGGIIDLSIERFGHLMTNAISFFTVLRSFKA